MKDLPFFRSSCSLLLCAACACGKGSASAPSAATPSAAVVVHDGAVVATDAAPVVPEDPLLTDLWTRAKDGDADDLARLCDRVGSDGLVEGFSAAPRRLIALHALAYADDFAALPFLAGVAAKGTDEEAGAALDSVAFMAAEPRRATDPEDALEIHDGCASLVLLAKDPKVLAPRRLLAVRALRMLVDRGWVARADVPTDLDSH
jgi:hypothetical protein